jgi:type VI secretion system VasD/TssJ family lipoprotein
MVLTLTASDQLNVFDDKPHAVSLCVYQLAGPGAFSTRGRTAEGLAELLSCKMLDATVLSYDRLFVQPSQSERKVISRTAGAEYIGIVAGYYEASAGATTILTRFDNTAARLNLAADGIRLRKTGRSAAKK